MSNCIGFDGKLYYNTGTNAAPTWVELSAARDVSTSASADAADTSDRGSKFKKYCAGMLDLETTVTFTYRSNDTDLAALHTKYLNRETVQIAVMDSDINVGGAEGFVYYAHITSSDFDQALNDSMTFSMTFVPAYEDEGSGTAVDPEWRAI